MVCLQELTQACTSPALTEGVSGHFCQLDDIEDFVIEAVSGGTIVDHFYLSLRAGVAS